jgi:hypothetical protein
MTRGMQLNGDQRAWPDGRTSNSAAFSRSPAVERTVLRFCCDSISRTNPQKLALTSPTSGGRSVGIVRLRTKSHGVFSVTTA